MHLKGGFFFWEGLETRVIGPLIWVITTGILFKALNPKPFLLWVLHRLFVSLNATGGFPIKAHLEEGFQMLSGLCRGLGFLSECGPRV